MEKEERNKEIITQKKDEELTTITRIRKLDQKPEEKQEIKESDANKTKPSIAEQNIAATIRNKKKQKCKKKQENQQNTKEQANNGKIEIEKAKSLTDVSLGKIIELNEKVEIIEDCRILSKDIKERFSALEYSKLLSLATKNQVVHLCDCGTEVNFSKPKEIISYIATKAFNFAEVYSLSELAYGGESIVYRGDFKLPLEVVVKTILPQKSGQVYFNTILSESHIIKLVENKEYAVDIFEEIIEVNKESGMIFNYIAVVEKALQDMKSLVKVWTDLEASMKQKELLTPHKLFYFAFQAASALQNLHQQNIYYGDMKEANLLIFRDYKVKIGDFGVSIKMQENNDPDEQIYELKGTTQAYSLSKYNEFIQSQQETKVSKNELLQNDYYTLYQTLNFIKFACFKELHKEQRQLRKEYQQEGDPKNRKHQQIYSYYQNFNPSLNDYSYFNEFLSEIKNLDPREMPLALLLAKYQKIIESDVTFLSTFCHQLVSDEKYYAIPTVLTLWKHRYISQSIQLYFQQQEYVEFPFMNLKQKTLLSSEKEQEEEKKEVQNQHKVIEEIQGYIGTIDPEEILDIIVELVNYKGFLLDSFCNPFYRDLFGGLFRFNHLGSMKPLLNLLEEDRSVLVDYLKGLKLTKATQDNINSYLLLLDDPQFRTFTRFLSFLSCTTCSDDPVDDIISTFWRKLSREFAQAIKYNLQEFDQKTLLQLQWLFQIHSSLQNVASFKQENPYEMRVCQELGLLFETKSMQLNYSLYAAYHIEHKELLKVFIDLLSSQKDRQLPVSQEGDSSAEPVKVSQSKTKLPQFHFSTFGPISIIYQELNEASLLERIQSFCEYRSLTHSQTLDFITKLPFDEFESLEMIQTVFSYIKANLSVSFSQLDSKMSFLNYKLYKLGKENSKPNMVSDEDLTLLIKAANYSPIVQKQKYMMELIEEFQSRGKTAEMDYLMEQCQYVSPLLHSILEFNRLGQKERPQTSLQLLKEIFETDLMDIFRQIGNLNPSFLKVLINYFHITDLPRTFYDFDSLMLQICLKHFLYWLTETYRSMETQSPQKEGELSPSKLEFSSSIFNLEEMKSNTNLMKRENMMIDSIGDTFQDILENQLLQKTIRKLGNKVKIEKKDQIRKVDIDFKKGIAVHFEYENSKVRGEQKITNNGIELQMISNSEGSIEHYATINSIQEFVQADREKLYKRVGMELSEDQQQKHFTSNYPEEYFGQSFKENKEVQFLEGTFFKKRLKHGREIRFQQDNIVRIDESKIGSTTRVSYGHQDKYLHFQIHQNDQLIYVLSRNMVRLRIPNFKHLLPDDRDECWVYHKDKKSFSLYENQSLFQEMLENNLANDGEQQVIKLHQKHGLIQFVSKHSLNPDKKGTVDVLNDATNSALKMYKYAKLLQELQLGPQIISSRSFHENQLIKSIRECDSIGQIQLYIQISIYICIIFSTLEVLLFLDVKVLAVQVRPSSTFSVLSRYTD